MKAKAMLLGLLSGTLAVHGSPLWAAPPFRPMPPAPPPPPSPQTDRSAEPVSDRQPRPPIALLDCGRNAIAEAMRDLFAPAPAPRRILSSQLLSRCRAVGAEGVLAAALRQEQDESTALEMARALSTFRSPVATTALRDVALTSPSPAVRKTVAPALATAGVTDELVALLGDVRESESVRAAALEALIDGGRPPNRAYLDWLLRNSTGQLRRRAGDLLAASPALPVTEGPVAQVDDVASPVSPPASAVRIPSTPSKSPTGPTQTESGDTQAATPTPTPSREPTPKSKPARTGPIDGTPLAIGASTVAGGALMLNLSLLGFQDVTPQLLLGSAGAVIGFGTSWALSRFGVRPTLEQAAWFANVTAWGTLAGITIYEGSDTENYKLRYFSLVAGEAVGMVAGVWSARRWQWSTGQIAMSDSLFLGAAVTGIGINRLREEEPRVTPMAALGVLPAMVGAAIVGHALQPTSRDIALMTSAAVASGWLGGLATSGIARTDLFGSRQGQGGLFIGLGLGYLGGAAAGAFTEVAPLRLQMGAAGLLAGNALGLGVSMVATGIERNDAGLFAAGDRQGWKLGAALGGVTLGAAAFAMAPHLTLREGTLAMTAWGAAYGAGIYWTALAASYNGQPQNETTDAVMNGGLLATGVAGGITGLLLARRFAPDVAAQFTTFGATAAATAAGWGTAAMLTNERGTGDAVGVVAGAGVGLATGAAFAHFHRQHLRPPALVASVAGAGYGALFGALLPSLAEPIWSGGRTIQGATALGIGGGALAGAAVGELTGATAGQVAVPLVAGVLGLGVGTGAGMLMGDQDSQPVRIGATVGTAAFLGGSIVADRWLRLSDGLGPSAGGMALVGGAFGALEGWWLAGALAGDGTVDGASSSAPQGGLFLGTSAGVAAGLALSRTLRPSSRDLALASGSSLLLASAGYGMGELITGTEGRGTTVATMSGAAVGLVGGALAAPYIHLEGPVVGGALVGGTAGMLVGALVPSLDEPTWNYSTRDDGALRVGLAAGLLGGGAIAQTTGANAREVAAVGMGATLGLGMGLGAGTLWPGGDSQAERIGTVAGVASLGTASLLLTRHLRLADPLPEGGGATIVTTTALGLFDGYWLAAMVDSSGLPSRTPASRLMGGLLLGGSAGMATGFLLAPRLQLSAGDQLTLVGGTLAGAGVGRGIALLATDASGRGDSLATLAGAAVGTAAGAVLVSQVEPRAVDGAAAVVGAGYGGLLGALLPTIGDASWSGWSRQTSGGLVLGAGAGAATGVAARLSLRADERDVGLTALAGADGAVTGIGWAMLFGGNGDAGDEMRDGPNDSGESRRLRLGTAIGTAAGLGLGMATWPRARLENGDASFIAASMALAGWNAAWIPALGHGSSGDFDRKRMSGGFLAGAGTASFGAALLVPALEIDADLIANAIAMDAVFTAAGAGVGALASSRADAPVVGLLAGGASGLLVGGLLHDRIDLDSRDTPLLTLGVLEGLWIGAWLPRVLRAPASITDEQTVGGLAAGTFGGLGLSILASTKWQPDAGDVAVATAGSGVGAAITGGIALLSRDLEDQPAVGLLLAGTGAGLVTGGLLAPRLRLDGRVAGATSVGAALGASEALLFAWSARADGGDQYGGAALLGAGVGASLGLATATSLETSGGGTPAVAGFTAWGAWMGAFAGSLFARDAHEVTAGGLIGSNVGLLAGYGLLRTEAVDPGDFGWLSLFGAMGTVAGAAAGAPFASRGAPAPILAGLAIGPAVGMGIGALVLPRLRAARDSARSSTVAWNAAPGPVVAPYTLAMRDDDGGTTTGRSSSPGAAPASKPVTGGQAEQGAKVATSSVGVAADLQIRHRLRRALARAVTASISISDCAPLIGALPMPDATTGGMSSPMMVGLTGRWQ